MARAKSDNVLLPHQTDGTAFLRSNKYAALFDEQGLGKSKQVIDAIGAEIEAGNLRGALIACPNGLKSTWAAEIERFSSLSYAVFGAGRKARRTAFRSLRAAFYVINYEAVETELASLRALLRFKPMAFVLDESHRIKTPAAKVTKAILKLRSDATRRYLLSGTPVANKPDDLWSQIFFLDGGESLGSTPEQFRSRYGSSRGYKNVDDLREQLSTFSMRRLKERTIQLPPKNASRVHIDLGGHQRVMYDKMRNELALWVTTLDGEQVLKQAEVILARLVRLAQLASNPGLLDAGYHEAPAKFTALDDLLTTHIDQRSQKAIVWTSFVGNIETLQMRYSQYHPVTLFGEMKTPERDRAVQAFRSDETVRLLVANPAAAREGLTLTEANVAIYLDRTFNLVDYLQSQDRIHRISQTRPCEIVLLLANATIDQFIDYSLEQKHRLARFVQKDSETIGPADLTLSKPELMRALLWPSDGSTTHDQPAG
ncbi:DEAD/DEAH box helicase [Mesorhizobium sp. WSM3859]|uniref:DEAD/DEAH box helicase n=1 Tax=Mesorhizobium sp. WSM3859 TaxID=2029402 RepID=UPI000BAEACDD|nr:DEAD/DEAH box helicase [Mesorhizobium sp. WSM3859]PBC10010.1 helicase [Mesorhizobium sp. WSM3859]